MSNAGLVDRQELYEMFPALRGRGKDPRHRIDWLVRRRALPGMVKIGRRIFFNPETIKDWINKNEIPVHHGDKR